jgi:peptidyl-prolyl cis-trans isomerase C
MARGTAPAPSGGHAAAPVARDIGQEEFSMTSRATFALALALLAGPAWAQAAKPADDPVVARVNGAEMRRSDVEFEARKVPPQVQRQLGDKLYGALLDRMVGATLLAQAGRKAKLQDDPEVKRRIAMATDEIVAEAYVDQMLRKGITDAKLKARYDKFVKDAPPREEINARHILLANEADAKAVIDQLRKGADFAAIAKEKSTDPAGKTSGGDLGWFTKDQMVPEFADAAFKLKKGEITETPVKTQFGWHVIKVEDRRTAPPPSFEQVKQQLADDLAREMIGEKTKELRTAAKIEVFNADGSKPGAPPPPAAPAPAPAPAAHPQPNPDIPTLSPATKPKD